MTATPSPSAESLWEDIATLTVLHRMRLTAEQATDWASRLTALQAVLDGHRDRENSPPVIAVLLQMRQAALHGLPVTGEMWEQLSTAQEQAGGEEQWAGAEQQADDVASALAESLSDQQVADYIRSDTLEHARGIVIEAREVLATPRDTWTAWLERTVQDIVLDAPDLPAGAEDRLREFFTRLRAMSGDELDDKQEQIVGELLDIIAPLGTPGELYAQARERLRDQVLYNRGLLNCLRDYAAVAGRG